MSFVDKISKNKTLLLDRYKIHQLLKLEPVNADKLLLQHSVNEIAKMDIPLLLFCNCRNSVFEESVLVQSHGLIVDFEVKQDLVRVTLIHKKQKVKREQMVYRIVDDKLVEMSQKIFLEQEDKKPEASFNLETNEKQIQQKQEMVLPYIHYEPDQNDDFDQEDPDDDLDI